MSSAAGTPTWISTGSAKWSEGVGVSQELPKERVRAQINRWRENLIDLTYRNPLLNYQERKASLTVGSPSLDAILAGLAGASGSWRFTTADNRSDSALVTSISEPDDLQAALDSLAKKTTEDQLDLGIHTLYLGAGMVRWDDPEKGRADIRSPLVLVPINLVRPAKAKPRELVRATHEDLVVNPALVLKASKDLGVDLDVGDIEADGVVDFIALARAELARVPGWTVDDAVVVSRFMFTKEVMYRDLLQNEDAVAEHQIVQALALGNDFDGNLDFEPIPMEQLDEAAPPEEMVTVLDADSSQRQCILAARTGKSFVMDGPPGTGKSQTITNMIAELITLGRTVLFVSEKAAALDVVQARLQDRGLGDFVLELHSNKANKREVAQVLGLALSRKPSLPPGISNARRDDAMRRRRELTAYAAAMNDRREPLGRSLHEVLGRVAGLHRLPQGPLPTGIGLDLDEEHLASILTTAGQLGRAWTPVTKGDEFLWRQLSDLDPSPAHKREAAGKVEAAELAATSLRDRTREVAESLGLPWRDTPSHTTALIEILELLQSPERADADGRWLGADDLEAEHARATALGEAVNAYSACSAQLEQVIGADWRRLDTHSADSMADAKEGLRRSPISMELTDSMSEDAVQTQRNALDAGGRVLPELWAWGEWLAQALGVPQQNLSIIRIRQLVDLARLSANPNPPEPMWLNPVATEAIQEAWVVLQSLVEDYRTRQDALTSVFTDAVLELDLQGMVTRFETVHTGIHKFRGAYREDKRALASCCRSGKAGKSELAHLREALAWQECTTRLRKAEGDRAGHLGSYYRSTETDFSSLTRALEVAEQALALAGPDADLATLQHRLARGLVHDPSVIQTAERVNTISNGWSAATTQLDPALLASLESAEIITTESWIAAAVIGLDRISAAIAHVSDVANHPVDLGTADRSLRASAYLSAIETQVASNAPDDLRLLGAVADGLNTDLARLQRALEWAEVLRQLIGGPVRAVTANRLLGTTLAPDDLTPQLAQWREAREAVLALFEASRAQELARDLDLGFEDAGELLSRLGADIDDMSEWIQYTTTVDVLTAAGLAGVVEFCTSNSVPAGNVEGVLERAILERWLDLVLEGDERLGTSRGSDRDALQREFRQLDHDLVATAPALAIEACNSRRPRSSIGAPGVIQTEANKKSRHRPIRKLLDETGSVAQLLKPCFMMSPLSVSQYLPATLEFDVVIFDEASQVRPADALNAVYRGKQLIVAGDQKQLPPTNFFDLGFEEDESFDDSQLEDFESVLDLSKRGSLPSLSLLWHYRSRHEDLITYSNYSFYEGRLVTFPGAEQGRGDLGIELFKVDGTYRRGGQRDNPIEAKAVVDRMVHHFTNRPGDSLGVVAFSTAQEACIERELEACRRDHPELDSHFTEDRMHGVFVKNLESVQGDERDTIIFSIGYGPDEMGKFTLNMGPLNKPNGQRRLNVAITRARKRVELVTSVLPEDFVGNSAAEGVRHLKRYLDFADRGMPALSLDLEESVGDAESPFEEEVLRVIRGWGYEAVPQVGVAGYRIDMAIRHPEKPGTFALGIECDGAMYHSSRVARDRDRLRQEVLEGLGWQIYRIWGTTWYRDRARAEAELRAAIDDAVAGTRVREMEEARRHPSVAEKLEFEATSLDEVPDWTVPYQVARLTALGDSEIFDPAMQPRVRKLVEAVVDVEGPVDEAVVVQRVRIAWGHNRSGARISAAITDAIKASLRADVICRMDSTFLSVPGRVVDVVRIPSETAEGSERTITQVPPDELRLALTLLLADAGSVSEDDLSFHVSRLFGWGRRSSAMSATIERLIEELEIEGVVLRIGDRLAPGAPEP